MIANENRAAGNNSRQNLLVPGIVDNGDNQNEDSGQR